VQFLCWQVDKIVLQRCFQTLNEILQFDCRLCILAGFLECWNINLKAVLMWFKISAGCKCDHNFGYEYAQVEVTLHSPWSWYDRHFVCITRFVGITRFTCNALRWMAKIYRVIQIKLNQLVWENVHMITDLPTKRIFKRCHNDKRLREFYQQDGGKNQLA